MENFLSKWPKIIGKLVNKQKLEAVQVRNNIQHVFASVARTHPMGESPYKHCEPSKASRVIFGNREGGSHQGCPLRYGQQGMYKQGKTDILLPSGDFKFSLVHL